MENASAWAMHPRTDGRTTRKHNASGGPVCYMGVGLQIAPMQHAGIFNLVQKIHE